MNNKYYITTTLPYVNAKPHIGFALEIIQADVLARWQRNLGKEVFFNTGTDEHGQKIAKAAADLEARRGSSAHADAGRRGRHAAAETAAAPIVFDSMIAGPPVP